MKWQIKKFLFFTFFIGLILIVHRVWADSIDGVTLMCTQGNSQVSNLQTEPIIYTFKNKKAFATYIAKKGALNKIAKKGDGYFYISTSHYIGWCEGNSYRNNCHEFDRDTLHLTITKFGAPPAQYECRVISSIELENYIK